MTVRVFPLSPCNYERILFAVIKNDKFRTHNSKVGRKLRQHVEVRVRERERGRDWSEDQMKYAFVQFTRLIAFIKLSFTTFEAQHKKNEKRERFLMLNSW